MGSTARSNRTVRAVVVAAAVAVSAPASVNIAASPSSATPATTVAQVRSGPVDLAPPVFSDPTHITNPLFPMSDVEQVIQLGSEGDAALRHEITQLDRTKIIEWNGRQIPTVVSQFAAYGDGRLLEVAVDYFAQADDGSVWYLGESVDNYEDGVIANHDGTWLAGRDGPAGMIMPAHPHAGDVYRPENIPGLVFEEVTVQQTGMTVPGPRGPVSGSILVRERPMDGNVEDKVFAPGYGEFTADVPADSEHVDVAIAVPIDRSNDRRDDRERRDLLRIAATARTIFAAAPTTKWRRASATADQVQARWSSLRRQPLPPLLEAAMTSAIETLEATISSRDIAATRQSAITVGRATADLRMLFEGVDRVDHARASVWRDQLVVDRASGDSSGVAGDRATLRALRARIGS
jgi:hypothetical protein